MEQPPDVEEDDCLPDYRHLFCPDLLQGKVAFITGGGSGIGFRITEIFMRHGCQTVIVSRSLPRVLMAAKKLAAATGQCCLPLSMDVRDTPAIMAAVDQALKEFGKIDILINCAAGNFLCPASALSFNAFKTVVEIDTIGTFNVTRVLYEKFFQDHGGVIVNITATLSLRGQVLQVHAGSAKAAVGMVPLVCPRGSPVAPSADCFGGWQASHEPESTCRPQRGMALALSHHRTSHSRQSGFAYFPSFRADAMTRHLAVEWGPQNIRVNSLAPGPISGTEGLRRLGGIQASLSKELPHSPLQRMGNKTEIAHSALYLASPLASYVTGIMLVVDGGCWLTQPNDIKKLVNLESTSAKL